VSDDVPAVVVTGGDGRVIAQNTPARRLLGLGTGKPCCEVVGKLESAEMLPCRRECVAEMLVSGMDCSRRTHFQLGGKRHYLSCIPVKGVVVCMLSCTGGAASSQDWPLLSAREREILRLLADGQTTASAAERLGVRESTVRTHVERMRCKFRVSTRAAVVAEGFRLGYLD